MICLVLAEKTVSDNLKSLALYKAFISMAELRADFLLPSEHSKIESFSEKAGLPVILTVRKKADGGQWEGSETERLGLLSKSISGGFAYTDLEETLPPQPWEEEFMEKGGRIIRSFHDFDKVPENLTERVKNMAHRPGEIPKAAVMPRNTAELLTIFKTAKALTGLEKILLGMGDVGIPTRILARRIGSLLTFASPPGSHAAPGHMDPKTLERVYGYSTIGKETELFGIIGNPVMHTKSPLIHNSAYRTLGLNAAYIPFQIEDPEVFLSWAADFGFKGFSVTAPHKMRVIALLSRKDRAVEDVGSCNTLLRSREGWDGYNTDVDGFIAPLKVLKGNHGLKGLKAAVIGAGGVARAVVYGLLREGAEVTIYNRTLSKAQELGERFGCGFEELGAGRLIGEVDLIVQTTVVGMLPHYPGDPVPGCRFTGQELAYDLIYAPAETEFLMRASEAGCPTIGGMAMLKAQGAAQFRKFTGKELP